ncbi:MAG: hypothetical protein ACRC8M_09190 [Cetobacterium sp.]|uniref:hypothetical protein n=1 Tax=Cetobacterium sp. TaxID=2071632 RepID=UPI003F36FEF4
MSKKNFFIVSIVIFSLILGVLIKFLSLREEDFIYVVPKIKNMEILDEQIGEYSLYNKFGDTNLNFESKDFLNGKIFLNVPNGNYILKGKYEDEVKNIPFIKESTWEEIEIEFIGNQFSEKQEYFLNAITLSLVLLNLSIFLKLKKQLKEDKTLYLTSFILFLNLILSFRIKRYTDIIKILDFLTVTILGFTLAFYLINKFISSKYNIIKKGFISTLFISYLHSFIIALIIVSPQIYTYLLLNFEYLIKIIRFVGKNLSLSRVIFLIILFILFSKKRNILKNICWGFVLIGYFFLESFNLFFPNLTGLSNFLRVLTYVSLYWGIVFYSLKAYNQNVSRFIKFILGFSLVYITLFYYKNLEQPTLTLAIILILDFYNYIFDKIFLRKSYTIEKTFNKLVLIKEQKQFEIQLKDEILKNTNLRIIEVKIFKNYDEQNYIIKKDFEVYNSNLFIDKKNIYNSEYTSALRIPFGNNPCIGVILFKDPENYLGIDEINYLTGTIEKISSLVNSIRLSLIYEELASHE